MPAHTSRERPKKHWTTYIGQAAAHPAAFAVVLIYALLWIIFDRRTFDFNAVATLAVWIMTLFIQRSSRRDTLAIHAKLDELLRADENARSELALLMKKNRSSLSNIATPKCGRFAKSANKPRRNRKRKRGDALPSGALGERSCAHHTSWPVWVLRH